MHPRIQAGPVVSWSSKPNSCEVCVAKPNYSFEKRQRELEKKKKKEEKNQRKLAKGSAPDASTVAQASVPADAGIPAENA